MTSVVGLIARREITTRLQQRAYRIALAVVFVLVALGCSLPAAFGGGSSKPNYDVGVVGNPVPGLRDAIASVAHTQGAIATVHLASAHDAEAKVRDGDWGAAVLPGNKLIAKDTGNGAVKIVQSAYQVAATIDRLRGAGLTSGQIAATLDVTPLHVRATRSGTDVERQTIAIVAVVVLFSQLITFCSWVAIGVVEEKTSRVVELMLSAVRPLQLLAGKLIGIGVLAAGQVLLLGVTALVAASLSGTLTVPASATISVVVAFVAFVLGYAFFASLAAAFASTVSRQEEVSSVMAPVTMSLLLCYGAGFGASFAGQSTFARVISIVPPFSINAMPARIAQGSVPLLDLVLSVALLAGASTAVLFVAARIYRASVLHSGTRVSLRRAWRGEAVSGLS